MTVVKLWFIHPKGWLVNTVTHESQLCLGYPIPESGGSDGWGGMC